MATQPSAVSVTVDRNRIAGWFADRRVVTKSLAAAAISMLAAVAVGGLSLVRMSELNDDLQTMKAVHVESLEHLAEIRGGTATTYQGLFVYNSGLAMGNEKYTEMGKASVAAGDAAIDEAVAAYRETGADSPARQAALTTYADAQAAYRVLRNLVIFQEAPPAGAKVPPAEEQEAAWFAADEDMAKALADLGQLERQESDQMIREADADYASARLWTLGALLVGLVLAVATAAGTARVMRRQLDATGAALASLAEGDLSRTAEVHARDELGGMAEAVNQASAGIRATVESLASGARTLGESTQQLTAVTGRIGSSAEEAAAQANLVTSAAGEVSGNVQTVAAGSEQMGSSIKEIAQNANDAVNVAAKAVEVATSTNQTVSKLGDSSAEIGNVVKVITSIAEQTNLLALNATIEAARAGEAGKGFAVVANEVKELAQETARATEDISQRVEAIQSDTTNAVAAIGEISAIIGRINDYQLTIASAVEQQTATTNEMSRSVADAAAGTTDIAANIGGVAAATQATTASLAEADRTVTELAELTGELQAAVARFRL